jgi:hypothetical protein
LPLVNVSIEVNKKEEAMNNPNRDGQQHQGRQHDQGGQRGGQKPARVVNSRAGRTSPVSKVVSNADQKSKARQTPGLSYTDVLQLSGSFCFLIDNAFGNLRQCCVGLLFFGEGLIKQTDRAAQPQLVGPSFERAVARDFIMFDRLRCRE